MNTDNDRHILFVDDEPKIRSVIGETLAQCGLEVSCFGRAEDCLDHLGNQECDLLITDLRLPEMDGIELLRRAKAITPWMPVLIITAYGDVPTAVEAIKTGAADFIEKPLDRKSFVRKVQSLLSKNGDHEHLGDSLTRSEQRVLRLVLDGKSNKEIADLLSRSRRTIEVHRASVMQKLGVRSLIDLVKRTMLNTWHDRSSSSFEERSPSKYVVTTMDKHQEEQYEQAGS